MAYSDTSVLAKLTSLSETQDSITTTAQWLLFHRRHADRTAQLWLQRLNQSPLPKRLNLIYLANEVVQQSRARGKRDFLLAFEPIVAEATGVAYQGQSVSVQGKVRRVVEVWRERGVFEKGILDAVEERMAEVDRSKGAKSGGGKLGGTLFGGSGAGVGGGGGVPPELEGLSQSQIAVSKAEVAHRPLVDTAEKEYAKMTDPNTPLPTPPVHAARLSALMKALGNAQGAVETSLTARKALLAELETLIATHRSKVADEETTVTTLATRREGIEAKKREVEDGIMRGLSNPPSPGILTPTSGLPPATASASASAGAQANGGPTANGPEAESFTPPPPDVEAFTPELAGAEGTTTTGDLAPLATAEDSIMADDIQANSTDAEAVFAHPPTFTEPPPAFEPPTVLETTGPSLTNDNSAMAAANGFLHNLNSNDRVRQASTELPASATNGNPGDPRLKRRKMNHSSPTKQASADIDNDIFGGAGSAGIDEAGVEAMLAQ